MHFCFEHTVALRRESVFAFFENPERIKMLHAGERLRVLHCETQVRVGGETWVEVVVARVLPLVLGFRHVLFEPSVQFAEIAIHGPFSRFLHAHEFESRAGGTVVRDRLEISLPWYYGGEMGVKLLVAPEVKRMFRHRAKALHDLIRNEATARRNQEK
jgi:ligand-binding SRPBCC domain-containing protein